MRRVRYYEHGGPEVLQLEQVDEPEPQAGQVLIRAEAIGANFVDTKMRRGAGSVFQNELPGKVTGDVVGTVERVGPNVDPSLVGTRVGALVHDAFADYAIADADWLAPIPDGIDPGLATMLPMGAPVALGVLRLGRLTPGETVLVHAAAGGIGHLAVQLAKLLGAGTVIATASSSAKLAFAEAHGADVAIDYSQADWADRVREAAPNGVHLVADSVGGTVFERSVELLAPLGRLVIYGLASEAMPSIPIRALYGLKSVAGFSILGFRAADPEQARQHVGQLTEYASTGRLRTSVHATFPLTEAAEAHRVLENREQLGRVLVIP